MMLARRVGNRRPSARFPHAEITWSCSENTVWTAVHCALVVGVVEELDGCYVANDAVTGTYNTYRTLTEAMESFELPHN